MRPLFAPEAMRAFDAYASARGTPSLLLMENAGRGAYEVLARELLGGAPAGKRVVLAAGRGNNGGDAFVVARRLTVVGAEAVVYCPVGVGALMGDALTNAEAFVGLGGQVHLLDERGLEAFARDVTAADAVVDGLFGTGLARAIEGPSRVAVERIAEARRKVLALDLPSGLCGRTGEVLGAAVLAAHTATFVGEKLGTATPVGREHAGVVHVVDIGVPLALPGLPPAARATAWCLAEDDVRGALAPRPASVHKYRAGHVAVLGGSPGKTGAALLAALGAARAGAGATTLAAARSTVAAFEMRVLESMTAALDDAHSLGEGALRDRMHRGGGGAHGGGAAGEGGPSVRGLVELLAGKRAIVVGPGLGRGPWARALVERVLALAEAPVVLDADGFAGLEGRLSALRDRRGPTVLLPHEGELGRLLGVSAADIARDRFGAAREAALTSGAIVVLKGACTVIAAWAQAGADGGADEVTLRVVDEGTPTLAVAGSGDVLAGIVGAFACELPLARAAELGVFVHARAGRAWARAHGERGMLAREIAEGVPAVLAGLTGPRGAA
ncbi:MAG: NAD(P)H-hydrate dehydratase [Myxococcales bacterium]|nr:NAD(P)H-hydrate dehydratase [Myxococcales bacterium]MBL0197985.1 NAD(P)H-hydrate dehydratase [Myxococcales bacterium]